MPVTYYEIQHAALLQVKKMEEGKTNDKVEKKEKVVMAMCCPDDEAAEEIKEKVLLKIGEGLEGRSNVVMTRLSDEDLKLIDALVEVEAFKSRSEAAAFFIKEGVQARKDLFEKVMPTIDRIRALKEQAKKSLSQGTTS
jgi:Arc/MetJ-type ribon-helix-helix transcriptional regulator